MPGVLVIAYYFPPLGGAGVQRTLKFVKYLPDFGWRPSVLSVRSTHGLRDSSLFAELPAQLRITRTPALQPPGFLPWRLRSFISRWLLTIDEQVGWLPFAVSAGRKTIASADDIRVIYSSSAPFTSHLVALSLHRQTHLPWVADFRDPWMANPFIKFPTTLHRQVNSHLEQSVFSEAGRVILNTETAHEHYVRKYPAIPSGRMVTLPNGYDQADFAIHRVEPHQNPVLTIVHLGSLYQKTRSSEYFLRGLRLALQDGRLPADKIRLRFIGSIDKETSRYVHLLQLEGQVELVGYLPHRAALSQLVSADLLVLIPSYGDGSELFVPAKLYEYLASRKPILCLSEVGPCVDLVDQARAGWHVSPTDPVKIAEQLAMLYQRWKNRTLEINSDEELIASFERRRLTERLAGMFNELVERA